MANLLSGTRIYGTANVDTAIYIGSAANTIVGADSISVGKASFIANDDIIVIKEGIAIQAGSNIGTAGQVLTSNGTGNVYWSTPAATSSFDYGLTYAIKAISF